ncbi:serine/threonine-protein kinase [Thalassoroseus pseudoceratinae]|uniref:serine/threonine-protein kinase n=1 Tax=Thalassoroseus pseudoceratinae TaxID=2713176 RepID=UPI001422276B|nr:serine/threonine-protein kinase [Thalassoroseus pseudoceratinae]
MHSSSEVCPNCGVQLSVKQSSSSAIHCPVCGRSYKTKKASNRPSASLSTNRSATPPDDSDKSIARFRVVEKLGEGAFGVVYRAYDPVLEREVALKCGKFPVDDRARRRRFSQEARAAAKLHHPNIVSVFDSGRTDDDQYYIANELIDGGTLADVISRKSIKLRTKINWVRELAIALAYAHEEGVVHRDLKPENILLDRRTRRPMIADFGLAKQTNTNSSLQTQDGSLLGTPAYMSPEQARGNVQAIGPRSDQYSLAVVLFEILTGECPYVGPTHAVLLAVASEVEVPSALTIKPDLPEDLAAICSRGLEKQPNRRYPDLMAFADDLTCWLEGEPVSARPIGKWGRLTRWCRREPRLATSLIVTIILFIATSALGLVFAAYQSQTAQKLRKQREELEDALATATQERELADRRAVEVSRAAYRPNMSLAFREWQRKHVAQARPLLAACDKDVREWEWYFLNKELKPHYEAVIPHQPTRFLDSQPYPLVVSSTRFIKHLTGSSFGLFRSYDAHLVREFPLSQTPPWTPSSIQKFMLDPSGEFLVTFSTPLAPSDDPNLLVRRKTDLTLWTTTNGHQLSIVHDDSMSFLGYAPDLSRIDLWHVDFDEQKLEVRDASIRRYRKRGYQLEFVEEIPVKLPSVFGVGKQPTTQKCVVFGRPSEYNLKDPLLLYQLDIQSGEIERTIDLTALGLTQSDFVQFDYHEPSNLLALTTKDGRLVCVSVDANPIDEATTFQQTVIDKQARSTADCLFSADGRQLLTWNGSRPVQVWSIPDLTLTSEFTEAGKVGRCQFSPSGHQVVTLDDQNAFVWDVEAYRVPSPRKIPNFRLQDVAATADQMIFAGNRLDPSSQLAQSTRNPELVFVPYGSDQIERRDLTDFTDGGICQLTLDPKGKSVCLREQSTGKRYFRLLAIDNSEVSLIHERAESDTDPFSTFSHPAVASNHLAVVGKVEPEIRLFNREAMDWSHRSSSKNSSFRGPRFSTDGSFLSWNLVKYDSKFDVRDRGVPWKNGRGLIYDLNDDKIIAEIPNTFIAQVGNHGRTVAAATLEPFTFFLIQMKWSGATLTETSRKPLAVSHEEMQEPGEFLPRSPRLLLPLRNGHLRVIDTSAAEELVSIPVFDDDKIDKLAVSPNGRYAVSVKSNGTYKVIDAGREYIKQLDSR